MAREDFPGVDYRTGLISDGFAVLENTSHRDASVLQRRPGYTRLAAVAGRVTSPFDGVLYEQAQDGTIRTVNLSTGAVSASRGTGSAGTAGCFARGGGRLYWTVAGGTPLVFDSAASTGRTVGITAPAGTIGAGTVTAAGGSITAGNHTIRYRYQNSTTGYISNPSGPRTLTLAANDKLTLSIGTDITAPPGSGVDTVIVEMTLTNGTQFFQAGTLTAGTLDITASDALLAVQVSTSTYYGDDGHNPMPAFNLITTHRSRLMGYLASSNLLAWSRPALPESWDITVYARKIAELEPSETITAMASFIGDLYLFTKYRVLRFAYDSDPTYGTVLSVPTREGAWNQRCIVEAEGQLFGFGANGIWTTGAIVPRHISKEVDPFIEANHDVTQSGDAFGWYSATDRSLTWVFTKTGDTEAKYGVTYSLRTQQWSTRSYKHEMLSATMAYNVVYYTTNNGYTWTESTSAYDGVSTGTIGTVTSVTGGGTTINVSETMPDCVGSHYTVGSETRLITGYTTNSLTIASAFSAPPAVGTVGVIGQIIPQFVTSWLVLDEKMAKLSRTAYFVVEAQPGPAGVLPALRAAIAYNFGANAPYVVGAGDTDPPGVTLVNGDVYARLDTNANATCPGYLAIPVNTQNTRVIEMTVIGQLPTQPFEILDYYVLPPDAVGKLPNAGQ